MRRRHLIEPELGGESAVDVDRKAGSIRNLEDMRVDYAGHLLQIMRQLGGDRIGLIVVRSGNANVDGRRLAKIQHLIDDIRRLEKEL